MSSSAPRVSVIIPCYNAEKWIAETLESVLRQSWKNIEVIVVNDGSTDGSLYVLNQYLSRNIKIINIRNQGQTAALNLGLARASGKYIQYLDADDLLGPDKIKRQVHRLIEQPGCIAKAEWARFVDNQNEAVFAPDETSQDMDPIDWLVTNWKDGGGMMYPAMWLLPMSVVKSIGPWREHLTLTNDTEYFTRAVLASNRVLFCEDAHTYYRSGIHGSLSGLKTIKGWESQFKVIELCQGYLLAREDSDRTRRVCAMLWQRLAHGCYPYSRILANEALARAHALHSARIIPDGGQTFVLVSRVFGWKAARVLQKWSGRQ